MRTAAVGCPHIAGVKTIAGVNTSLATLNSLQWPVPNRSTSENSEWPVPISCRSGNSKMAVGRIPEGFRWERDGAVTARLLATKAKFRVKMFWRHSAIWDMPVVAVGGHPGGFGTPCVLPSLRRPILLGGTKPGMPPRLPEPFFCTTFANEITGPSNMAILNLNCRERPGCGSTQTHVSRKWRNAFWSLT